jgi:hypothetical protein
MKKILILFAILTMIVMSGGSNVSAQTLGIDFNIVGDPIANPLDPFTVQIAGTLDPTSALFNSFAFELQYNESVLDINSASISSTNWPFQTITSQSDADGEIQMGGQQFSSGLPSGTLWAEIVFEFESLNSSSNLSLFPHPDTGVWETVTINPVETISGQFLNTDDSPKFVYNISNVPIPSTILLLGGGLVALVGLRRRKSS